MTDEPRAYEMAFMPDSSGGHLTEIKIMYSVSEMEQLRKQWIATVEARAVKAEAEVLRLRKTLRKLKEGAKVGK